MKTTIKFSLLAVLIGVSGCGYTPSSSRLPPSANAPSSSSMSPMAFIYPPTHNLVVKDGMPATTATANNAPDMTPASLAQLAPAAGGSSTPPTHDVYANMPPESLAQLSPAAGGSGTKKATPVVLHDYTPGATELRLQDNAKAISTDSYHPLGLMRTLPSDY